MTFFKTLFVFNLLLLAIGNENKWSVTLPDREINAFTGSCPLIPCTFDISDFGKLNTSGSIYAYWIKGGFELPKNTVVFNGTTNTTRLLERIEITGNLHQKNCTTIFYNVNKTHADKYYFRIKMIGFKATFTDKSFRLIVQDPPAAYSLSPRVSELSEVSEGTSVTLTCTAAAPCPSQPPTITWSLSTGNTHTHIQDEENSNRSLTSVLTFTANRSQNGRNISCTASYLRYNKTIVQRNSIVQRLRVQCKNHFIFLIDGRIAAAKKLSVICLSLFSYSISLALNTPYPPQVSPADVVASVSPSGPAAEGSSVTLTCNSSEANPPVQNYTWFRGDQDTPIGSRQTLTFNLSSSDEGLYYCRAEHPQKGVKSAAVRLMIKGHFPLPMVVGGCVGGPLLCVLIWIALRLKKSKTPLQDEQCTQHKDSGVCTDDSVLTSTSKTSEDLQEQILYGEIDFSKRPLRGSSKRTGQKQGQGQGQESVYAEVHLSGTDAQARYQEALDTEDLYAQVKRK